MSEEFKCEQCGQECASKAGLASHVRNNHPEEGGDSSRAELKADQEEKPDAEEEHEGLASAAPGKRKVDRKTRVPLGALRARMTVKDVPEGKVLRWLNDKGTRLTDAVEGGYDFVYDREKENKVGDSYSSGNTDMGTRVSRVVDKSSNAGMRAYLMMIDKEWYDDDQAAKQDKIDETEKGIYGEEHEKKPGNHVYVPNGAKANSIKTEEIKD